MIEYNYVHERFNYDPESGILTWKKREEIKRYDYRWNIQYAEKRAGGLDEEQGYRKVTLDGIRYREHRLIWLWMTGNFPKEQIDHINGDRSDNRWNNLREANNSENQQNKKAKNKSGIYWSEKRKKWSAQIGINGKNIFLGRFADSDAAHNAYLLAKAKYHRFQPEIRKESIDGMVGGK